MIILKHIEQRSDAWFAARMGVPTGSEFNRIFTSTLKPSAPKTQQGYIDELIGECFGEQKRFYSNADMERGVEYEDEAKQRYTEKTGIELTEVGGVFHDEKRNALVSPDGLAMNERGGVEIKCTIIKVHLNRIREDRIPTEYLPQCLGGLWATGYDWWDFVDYAPSLPDSHPQKLWIKRIERDEETMRIVDEIMRDFLDRLETTKKNLGVAA